MQLSRLLKKLDSIAPLAQAEPWDNVGLLVGDPRQEIAGIMLSIDYTDAVAKEAQSAGCDFVIAYHPPIFEPIKRVLAGNVVFDALRRGVAIYSPHTALDVADDGTNDTLADALGLENRQPLRATAAKATQYKLVVFVPLDHVQRLGQTLFDAGAGHIGNYSSCSFRSPGTGTFFGQEGTAPAVGRPGRLEEVPEIRLETLVPIEKVDSIVRALRQSHPYEEPAFDLNLLAPSPTGKGQGRIGTLPQADRQALFHRIKHELELSHLLIAGPTEGAITCAAVGAGSCGDMLDDVIAAGAELYLTGEMRHHDAVKAVAAGITVVCTLHSNSERAVLKRLKKRLEQVPGVPPISISQSDRDPFVIG
ncbi:MAG: Nif3-like dinuclear metal center hexameric protein [Tepidisphaeraceae bacterium]|jgi:dinuclear metal center YbgI/SA1388 family protein